MGYQWSYSNDVASIEKSIRSLETLVCESTEGDLCDAILEVLSKLRKQLYLVEEKYANIPKKF